MPMTFTIYLLSGIIFIIIGFIVANSRLYTLSNDMCSYDSIFTVDQCIIKKGTNKLTIKTTIPINNVGLVCLSRRKA